MPGVTISAGYGAGGSVVAPHVAKLLGFPLLDRAISSHVADQLHVSVKEAEGGAARRSLPDRFISALVPLGRRGDRHEHRYVAARPGRATWRRGGVP